MNLYHDVMMILTHVLAYSLQCNKYGVAWQWQKIILIDRFVSLGGLKRWIISVLPISQEGAC